MNLGAVFARGGEILRPSKLEFGEQGIVLVREAPECAALKYVNFSRLVIRRLKQGEYAVSLS